MVSVSSLCDRGYEVAKVWQGYMLGQPPQEKLHRVPGGTLQVVYSRYTSVGREVKVARCDGLLV